jgi:hypothetical protein
MKTVSDILKRIEYLGELDNKITCETIIGSKVKLMISSEINLLKNILDNEDWVFAYEWVFNEIEDELKRSGK